jgi:hypothetical protein
MRRVARGALLVGLIAAGAAAGGRDAAADPLRLRADALAQAESPAGLLSLEASSRLKPWLRAEALVWLGGGDETDANVLTIAVRLRHPAGLGDARIGRIMVTSGALRPVHLDGGAGRLNLPGRFSVDAWGGVPVAAGADRRTWDWTAGVRLSRALGEVGSVGVGFAEKRDHGRVADREVGADVLVVPFERLDAGARVSYDLVQTGISEAILTTSLRLGALRFELAAMHRSPSRLLPATSLFSVLGDSPSRRIGGTIRWRAAPRLDVDARISAIALDDDVGADMGLRARLKLDERGVGSIAAELRREALEENGWTGGRVLLNLPIGGAFAIGAELELAVPDDPRDRGDVWPWALAALRWRPAAAWEAAIAVEASATPKEESRVDALFRLSRSFTP